MKRVFQGKLPTSHGQLALVDVEDKGSYPVPETDMKATVFGPKGVLIPTAADERVEVVIYRDPEETEGRPSSGRSLTDRHRSPKVRVAARSLEYVRLALRASDGEAG